ncbi:M20/M25/M40 family metallo-hydrolase [Laribacter hongkongensis]|uniref:M20/M25/M40 family metallo-hydrolase n=1 Tax=Laribacter hongkongensis TaxID=168471 RepID=UPI001EFC9912|nr:M20/M25/M40 family metallo-hydrolase [Laribacter hongkongensis]MCG9059441.1 M20/M25/M40 family metallo-hydrolase [Laribacter hongkongensis]MCG9085520.1 M20/M25/M40 family metallo-hydrolase [Laribacter hongkongensis]
MSLRLAPICTACLIAFPLLASAAPLDPAKVKQIVGSQFDTFQQDHKTITEIESPTGDKAASLKMAQWVKDKLEPLGFRVEFRPNEKGTHVIATRQGKGALRVLMLGHTDTVQPVGNLAKKPYSYDPKTGYAQGPGAGDSKASVAQLIHFARSLDQLKFDNYKQLTFYFDAEEETGSATEDSILNELAQKHDLTLSVDSSPTDGGMNTERKWVVNYEIEVEGVTGHAGNSAQAASSATVELANQIVRIMKLASPLPKNPADYTNEALQKKGIEDHGQFIPPVTINVGVIKTSNTKVNSIPKDAYAKLDIRGFKTAEKDQIDAALKKIAATPTVAGTKVKLVGPSNYMPPMEKTPAAGRLAERYKSLMKEHYDIKVTEWATGGVSIGNFTSRYIPTIDGLGIETRDQHNLETETAYLKTFVPRTVTMILLLDNVASGEIKLK